MSRLLEIAPVLRAGTKALSRRGARGTHVTRVGMSVAVLVLAGLTAPVATTPATAEAGPPPPPEAATPVTDTSLTNTEAPVTTAPAGAPALVPTTEVVSLRTAHAKTYATDQPGKYTSRIYANPIHFKDPVGVWQDIDMTLVPEADGRLRSRAHSSTVSVAPVANDAQLARVDFDAKHSVALRARTWNQCSPSVRPLKLSVVAVVSNARSGPVVDVWFNVQE